jgi:hypothetical protein
MVRDAGEDDPTTGTFGQQRLDLCRPGAFTRFFGDRVDVVEEEVVLVGIYRRQDARFVVIDRLSELVGRSQLVHRVLAEREVKKLSGMGLRPDVVVEELIDEGGLPDTATPGEGEHAVVVDALALAFAFAIPVVVGPV